ncbi:MAG: hypothetical protein Q9186_007525 [Xanthomendoza sp. 1 TL-2023]
MNDVDMPDAGPSAPAKSKAIAKTAKTGGAADEGKKRFEVKKALNVKQINNQLPAKNVP